MISSVINCSLENDFANKKLAPVVGWVPLNFVSEGPEYCQSCEYRTEVQVISRFRCVQVSHLMVQTESLRVEIPDANGMPTQPRPWTCTLQEFIYLLSTLAACPIQA